MLKISKGLKKKKKDKKHKRKDDDDDDDLFNKEELEQYRKEHQQHSAAEATATANLSTERETSSTSTSTSALDKSDEWKKFNALTAGVDNILQKTQEDLDRIKSTSYFQRKAPAPPPPAEDKNKTQPENQDKPEKEDGDRIDVDSTDPKSRRLFEDFDEGKPDDEEEEEEEDDDDFADDGIFETSYVDAVASGELKLAYIPDSPTEEKEEYDPFDTSIADKVIEANPKKRYLNLGCAVEVLSGKINPGVAPPGLTLEKRTVKRRVKPVDLLLSSFDESSENVVVESLEKHSDSSIRKTLLDDDPIIESDLTVLPAPAPAPLTPSIAHTEVPSAPHIDLSEFELPVAVSAQHSVESVDEDFEKLATESLARKASTNEIQRPTSVDLLTKSDAASSGHPSPIVSIVPQTVQKEVDPFDTSSAEIHLRPGKCEIALIEQELLKTPHIELSQLEDDDFDPRAEPTPQTVQRQPDLLAESPVEEGFAKPLTPKATTPDFSEPEDFDPFDTSYVSGAPGKSELKLIEKELQIEEHRCSENITDQIFTKYNIAEKPSPPVEQSEYVDILTGDHAAEDPFVSTVQPKKCVDPEKNADIDPFDTSIADNIVPGKAELKVLENELIN